MTGAGGRRRGGMKTDRCEPITPAGRWLDESLLRRRLGDLVPLLEAVAAAEFLLEAVDASGGVDELLLAGKEGVAAAADVDLDEGVLPALVSDLVARGDGGAGKEGEVRGEVLEDDGAVDRVGALFHWQLLRLRIRGPDVRRGTLPATSAGRMKAER